MFKKVLIPVDVSVSEETQRLLQAAKSLTESWGCDCHVVTVIPSLGMPIVGFNFDPNFESERQTTVQNELSSAVATSGIAATEHVLSGTVYDNVIALASKINADLIILGAHQPELRDYLLGSNAARVVRHSKQSVLVLRD